MIREGRADAMITGGTEAAICEIAIAGFANSKALSTSEDPMAASLPFDIRRKGFVMGEGSGVMILEDYEIARKRGAHIYAEVCGYGNSCDAFHTSPSRCLIGVRLPSLTGMSGIRNEAPSNGPLQGTYTAGRRLASVAKRA